MISVLLNLQYAESAYVLVSLGKLSSTLVSLKPAHPHLKMIMARRS